jgi:hypothetical protein
MYRFADGTLKLFGTTSFNANNLVTLDTYQNVTGEKNFNVIHIPDGTQLNQPVSVFQLSEKSNIYNGVVPGITKRLADVSVGENLSGATITFTTNELFGTTPVNTPLINFYDGSYIMADSTSAVEGLFNLDGSLLQAFTENGLIVSPTYTFGSSKSVSSVDGTGIASRNLYTESTYTTRSTAVAADCEWLYNNAQDDAENLQSHRESDIYRWGEYYKTKEELLLFEEYVQGKKPDTPNIISVTDIVATEFTSTNVYGGYISATISNTENVFGEIILNGDIIDKTEGLPSNNPVTKYYLMNQNDTIKITCCQSATYTPFIIDDTSPTMKLVQSINNMNAKNALLETQLLDIQSTLQNKVLDSTTTKSIANQTFEVNNPLGGRIVGQGVRVISLLGLAVLSTGNISINGTQTYDNSSLVSAGSAPIYSQNVSLSDVIVSDGMSYLDYTDFVASS